MEARKNNGLADLPVDNSLTGLSNELLAHVSQYLSLNDIVSLLRTSKHFNTFFNVEMKYKSSPCRQHIRRTYGAFIEAKLVAEVRQQQADQARNRAINDVSHIGRNLPLSVATFQIFGDVGYGSHHRLLKAGMSCCLMGGGFAVGTLFAVGLTVGALAVSSELEPDDVRAILTSTLPVILLFSALLAIGSLLIGGTLCYSNLTLFNRVNNSVNADRENRRLAERMAAMEGGMLQINDPDTKVPDEITPLLRHAT